MAYAKTKSKKKPTAKKQWVKPERNITRPTAIDYSTEQQSVFDVFFNTDSNAVITAAAGSGKTFTIQHLLWKIADRRSDYKSLYVVFNSRNKTEAESKMPESCDVKTLHALGMQILKSAGPMRVDEHKVWNFLSIMFPDTSKGLTDKEKEKELKAYNRRKFLMKKLIDFSRIMLMDQSFEDLTECATLNQINITPQDIQLCATVLAEMNRQFFGDKTTIIPTNQVHTDFVDMRYLPVRFADKCKYSHNYDLVCLDEYQDTSRMMFELVQRWILSNPKTRYLAVGDPMQDIYGFAGADTQYFQILADRVNTESLTLSTCYRCKPAIVREAQKLVPSIQPMFSHDDGEVIQEGNYNDAQDLDFILCRKNRPIVAICLDMLREGRRAVVRGRDIAEDMLSILNQIGATTLTELLQGLETTKDNYLRQMIEGRGWDLARAKKSEEFKNLLDRCGVLEDMGNRFEVSQISSIIDSIFTDGKVNAVILSTVHKAKGLEADNVYILDLCQMESVELKYVAITRAKNKLVYCNHEGCGADVEEFE